MDVRLSAPGKLFLTGEYAVLWGAPATIAAVEPRLSATALPRPHGEVVLHVPWGTLRGRCEAASIAWRGTCTPARFSARALELALARAGAPMERGLDLRVGPGARGPDGRKLGLGSSAASVALAAAAGLTAGGRRSDVDPTEAFHVAALAHWEVQGRKGSGGDVAAACFGGVIRYRRYPVERAAAGEPAPAPDVQPLDANGLLLAIVSSGKASRTPSMVETMERALDGRARSAFCAHSEEITLAFCTALQAGQRANAIAALNRAGDILEELGQRAAIPVVTPGLARIQALGREYGLAAKVSGAGGGDGALFAGFDAQAMDAALAGARAEGFFTLALPLSGGVRIDAVP